MAKIEFPGFDEYAKQLKALGKDIEGICKYAVYDAAGMVADAVKANTPVDSGDLQNSIGLSRFRNDDGYINTKLVFEGYDSKGVPNALKARALESGTSKRPKHPFIRPAVNQVKNAAINTIRVQLDKKLYEITKGS